MAVGVSEPVGGAVVCHSARGPGGEVGGSRVAAEGADLFNNPVYLENDVKDFVAGRITKDQLAARPYDPTSFTTEKIKTWEVGYKTNYQNRLFVDAFLFRSKYNDFIATQNFYQLNTAGADLSTLSNVANYRSLQVNFNNFNEIFVNGWGLGVDYSLGGGFTVSGNYAHQVGLITIRDAQGNVVKDNAGEPIVERKMSNIEVSQKGRNFFISPENRYNITLANPRIRGGNVGFAVTYRWTDKMWVEQGTTAGDITLPSWNTVDAQVSLKMPALKSILKVGGSNIFNNYYSQGYGIAQIGGLYYVSLTFDQLMR